MCNANQAPVDKQEVQQSSGVHFIEVHSQSFGYGAGSLLGVMAVLILLCCICTQCRRIMNLCPQFFPAMPTQQPVPIQPVVTHVPGQIPAIYQPQSLPMPAIQYFPTHERVVLRERPRDTNLDTSTLELDRSPGERRRLRGYSHTF